MQAERGDDQSSSMNDTIGGNRQPNGQLSASFLCRILHPACPDKGVQTQPASLARCGCAVATEQFKQEGPQPWSWISTSASVAAIPT